MGHGAYGKWGYRGMGNGVQGYGAYAHRPHCPCALLAMWAYCPCGPYPLYPIPHVLLHCPCGPYPVPHTLCGPHCPCAPYPLGPIAPCLHIAPITHMTHYPMGGRVMGSGAHGAIVYMGYMGYRPHGHGDHMGHGAKKCQVVKWAMGAQGVCGTKEV